MEARAEAVFVMMVISFGIFCLTLVVLVIVARTSQSMQDALRTLKDGWRAMWLEGDSRPRVRRLDANVPRLRSAAAARRSAQRSKVRPPRRQPEARSRRRPRRR